MLSPSSVRIELNSWTLYWCPRIIWCCVGSTPLSPKNPHTFKLGPGIQEWVSVKWDLLERPCLIETCVLGRERMNGDGEVHLALLLENCELVWEVVKNLLFCFPSRVLQMLI